MVNQVTVVRGRKEEGRVVFRMPTCQKSWGLCPRVDGVFRRSRSRVDEGGGRYGRVLGLYLRDELGFGGGRAYRSLGVAGRLFWGFVNWQSQG